MVEVPPVTDEMHAAALAAVDVRMLDYMDAVEARLKKPIVRELPPIELQVKPDMRLHLEPSEWGVEYIEVRELDMFGGQLREDLKVVRPQALLRDLHRPVRQVHWYPFEPMMETLDHAGLKGTAEAKAAQHFERSQPIPSLTKIVREEQERRRTWLATPWQPHYRDDQDRPPVDVIHL